MKYKKEKIILALISGILVLFAYILIVLAADSGIGFRSIKAYTIVSGSMAPKIPLGSIIFTKPSPLYFIGDIIAFKSSEKNKTIVTHRISKTYETNTAFNSRYETKGDANNTKDSTLINYDQIVGEAFLTIPYIGYISRTAKSQKGFIFLIIVPATIIIYEELRTLKKELLNKLNKAKGDNDNGILNTREIKISAKQILFFILIIASTFVFTSYSHSFFSSRKENSQNSFVAGVWGEEVPTPTPTDIPHTPTVTLTPTPTTVLNKVVINEVYYDVGPGKGEESGSQSDEWVELYNPTNQDVNLKNWTLQDNGSSRTISNANKILPAYGFAVIAKNAQTWTYWSILETAVKIELGQEIGNGLSNSGDKLLLRDDNNQIVDQMSYGSDTSIFNPAAVDVAEGHSLERSPTGQDTDIASDFIDRTNPTPGN